MRPSEALSPRSTGIGSFLRHLLERQGMLLVLVLLCVAASVCTYRQQPVAGAAGGRQLASDVLRTAPSGRILLVGLTTTEDVQFLQAAEAELVNTGWTLARTVTAETPRDARRALADLNANPEGPLDLIGCTAATSRWQVFDERAKDFPNLGTPGLLTPRPVMWPTFLNTSNLLNVAQQISVIAVVAVGMTCVIVTGGIDLSVGSLIAFSAVSCCYLIERRFGGESTTTGAMLLAVAVGIAVCGLIGYASGALITVFRLPPFIVTLAVMLIVSGLAFQLTEGATMYKIPPGFVELGRGATLGLPNSVWLMLGLYVAAQIAMTRTIWGRWLYATGGNVQAAQLSGIQTDSLLRGAYTLSGLLAGVGGIMIASQLKSGSPTFGQMYELYVIAAVVVGGASLSGGSGTMFGTLVGALIIAVIRNLMNLLNVGAFMQNVVLGMVILGAVLLDQLRRKT